MDKSKIKPTGSDPDKARNAKVKKDVAYVDEETFQKAMKKVVRDNKPQLKRLKDK